MAPSTHREVKAEWKVGYSGDHGRLWVGADPQTAPSVVARAKNTHLEGRLRRRVGCAGATRQCRVVCPYRPWCLT